MESIFKNWIHSINIYLLLFIFEYICHYQISSASPLFNNTTTWSNGRKYILSSFTSISICSKTVYFGMLTKNLTNTNSYLFGLVIILSWISWPSSMQLSFLETLLKNSLLKCVFFASYRVQANSISADDSKLAWSLSTI